MSRTGEGDLQYTHDQGVMYGIMDLYYKTENNSIIMLV